MEETLVKLGMPVILSNGHGSMRSEPGVVKVADIGVVIGGPNRFGEFQIEWQLRKDITFVHPRWLKQPMI